jgi:hypothetical protein
MTPPFGITEIELPKNWDRIKIPLLAVGCLVALVITFVLLGWLGKAYTPQGGGILTTEEWTILKAQRAYDAELSRLQQIAEQLFALLGGSPDPVRAQVLVSRYETQLAGGQPALQAQRDGLMQAAEGVQFWALGQISREDATTLLNAAITGIANAAPEDALQHP